MSLKKAFCFIALAACCGCATVSGTSNARQSPNPTALDEYVHQDDGSYAWNIVDTQENEDGTLYTVALTSQTWPCPEEVDLRVWKHWLFIMKPKVLKTDKALLFISGGKNGGDKPDKPETEFAGIAKATGGVVAILHQVPNQPITFAADGKPRVEDSFIAYTWDKYLRTGDPLWLARLPMTKSAVRAMDCVQELIASPQGGGDKVNGFVVAGGSKRGWTTWTTAATDKRVIGEIPIVIDLLNMVPSFQHHYQAYGDWSPAVGDYVEQGLMAWSGTPEYDEMLKIVEPFSYRERYTMPKLIMNASGDQFFLPDSSQFYYDQLPNPKRLRYVPNADHGMGKSDAGMSILSFFQAIAWGKEMPNYTWTFPDANTIRVMTNEHPAEVKLWQAENPNGRDFRLAVIGPVWKETKLEDMGGGVYQATVDNPPAGYRAFMIELTFPGPGEAPFKFTSPIRVVPDNYQHGLPEVKEVPKGFLSK